MPDERRVGGTLFSWPDLPDAAVIGTSLHGRLVAERDDVVREAGRRRARCSAHGPHSRHSCVDPAACSLAQLVGRGPRWTGRFRPGQRVEWSVGELTRRGEVWDQAGGRFYWVHPDEPVESDRAWGLPRVHEGDLRPEG